MPPKTVSIIAVIIAVIAMCLAAMLLYPQDPERLERVPPALIFIAVGGVALGIAVKYKAKPLDFLMPSYVPLSDGRIRWWIVLIGLAALVITGEASARVTRLEFFRNMPTHAQFALLCIGTALIILGMSGSKISISRPQIQWRYLVPLIGIVGVAIFVRVWALDTAILRNIDETILSEASVLFTVQPNRPLMGSVTNDPIISRIYPYLNSWTIDIWGRNLLGARIFNAFLGSLNVLVVYEMSRIFFNRKVAFIAALVLATFPPHVHFSRISIAIIADLSVGALTVLFIGRALKWNKRMDWVLAGVALASTHYFTEVARLVTTPLLIVWLVWMVLMLPQRLRGYKHGFVLTVITCILVIIPPYYNMAATGMQFAGRFDSSADVRSAWSDLLENGIETEDEMRHLTLYLGAPFLVITTIRDTRYGFYDGVYGIMQPEIVPFYLLGFCFLLLYSRRPGFVFVIWLLAVSVGNILIVSTASHVRYMFFYVSLGVMIALGATYTWQIVEDHVKWIHRSPFLRRVPIIVGAFIAFGQGVYFFNYHIPEVNRSDWAFVGGGDIWDASLRAVALPDNTQTYVISRYPIDDGRMIRLMLLYEPYTYDLEYSLPESFSPASLPTDRNYGFFVMPDDTETHRRLEAAFGERLQGPLYNPTKPDIPETEVFGLYFVPKEGVEFDIATLDN
jgi:4-amino-4-deoxy-L-arabinose transferase-like glycosyltransferase